MNYNFLSLLWVNRTYPFWVLELAKYPSNSTSCFYILLTVFLVVQCFLVLYNPISLVLLLLASAIIWKHGCLFQCLEYLMGKHCQLLVISAGPSGWFRGLPRMKRRNNIDFFMCVQLISLNGFHLCLLCYKGQGFILHRWIIFHLV